MRDSIPESFTEAPGVKFPSTVAWMGGSISTREPVYLPGSIQPISLTTAGAVRTKQTNVTPVYAPSLLTNSTTSPSNLFVIESGPTKQTILRAIIINFSGTQTTAGIRTISFTRTTTASVGGVFVPSRYDNGDANFSGIFRALPSVLGTLDQGVGFDVDFFVPATITAAFAPIVVDFTLGGSIKGLVIPIGTSNGILVRDSGAPGATNLSLVLIFTEE